MGTLAVSIHKLIYKRLGGIELQHTHYDYDYIVNHYVKKKGL